MKKDTLSTIYTIAIFLVPVLSQYSIGPLDLDVVVMSILFLTIAFSNGVEFQNNRGIALLLFYIISITFLNLLGGTLYASSMEILLRLVKYALYLAMTMFFGVNQLITYEKGVKIFRVVAFCATTYLILQAIFYYAAGIVLPNTIGGNTNSIAGEEVGRLRSFYSEPSVMAYCNIPFVCCALFGEIYGKKDTRMFDAIYVSLGIVLSTSGQGIVCIGVLWGSWLVRNIVLDKIKLKEILTVIVVVLLLRAIYVSGILEFAVGRMTNTDEYGAISARASGYETWSLLNPVQLLFGTGYGNYVTLNVYNLDVPYDYVNYSSLAENVFVMGVVGSLFLYTILFHGFLKGDLRAKMVFLSIIVLGVSGCPLGAVYIPIYLSFLFISPEKEPIKITNKEVDSGKITK